MNRIVKVFLLVFLLSSSASAQKDKPPAQSWRPPTAAELGSAEEQK